MLQVELVGLRRIVNPTWIPCTLELLARESFLQLRKRHPHFLTRPQTRVKWRVIDGAYIDSGLSTLVAQLSHSDLLH